MRKTRAEGSSSYVTRRRWTEEDARQALAALEQSGLSLSAFSNRAKLDPQRLYRWRRRLGKVASLPFEEFCGPNAGASLVVEPVASGQPVARAVFEGFEIVLRSGRMVRVPESFDAHALQRLLDVVDEGRAC